MKICYDICQKQGMLFLLWVKNRVRISSTWFSVFKTLLLVSHIGYLSFVAKRPFSFACIDFLQSMAYILRSIYLLPPCAQLQIDSNLIGAVSAFSYSLRSSYQCLLNEPRKISKKTEGDCICSFGMHTKTIQHSSFWTGSFLELILARAFSQLPVQNIITVLVWHQNPHLLFQKSVERIMENLGRKWRAVQNFEFLLL